MYSLVEGPVQALVHMISFWVRCFILYCCSAVQFSSSQLYVVYQLKGVSHPRRLQAYTNICEIECRTNHKLLSVCPAVSIAGSASGHVDVAAFLYQFQEPRCLSPTSQAPAVYGDNAVWLFDQPETAKIFPGSLQSSMASNAVRYMEMCKNSIINEYRKLFQGRFRPSWNGNDVLKLPLENSSGQFA